MKVPNIYKRTFPVCNPQLIRLASALPITSKELEEMVETALRSADRVFINDRVKGDVRTYFRCKWDFWPCRFEVAWEIVASEFTILTFTVLNVNTNEVFPIRDTAQFAANYSLANEVRTKLLRGKL